MSLNNLFYVALKEKEKIQQPQKRERILAEVEMAEVEMAALNLRRRKEALVKETRRKEVLKGTDGTVRHGTTEIGGPDTDRDPGG